MAAALTSPRTRFYGIRIAVLLSFLCVCIAVYSMQNSAAMQHDCQTLGRCTPPWVNYLFIGFLSLPLAVSFFLLTRQSDEPRASGAGVAAGFFGASLLVSPLMLLSLYLPLGLSGVGGHADRGLVSGEICLLVFLALAIWAVIAAFLIGRAEWSLFVVAAIGTVIYLSAGFSRI
jgi:hypothetical protein